jgi:hypothetical protein
MIQASAGLGSARIARNRHETQDASWLGVFWFFSALPQQAMSRMHQCWFWLFAALSECPRTGCYQGKSRPDSRVHRCQWIGYSKSCAPERPLCRVSHRRLNVGQWFKRRSACSASQAAQDRDRFGRKHLLRRAYALPRCRRIRGPARNRLSPSIEAQCKECARRHTSSSGRASTECGNRAQTRWMVRA